jgi:hypothetical protein
MGVGPKYNCTSVLNGVLLPVLLFLSVVGGAATQGPLAAMCIVVDICDTLPPLNRLKYYQNVVCVLLSTYVTHTRHFFHFPPGWSANKRVGKVTRLSYPITEKQYREGPLQGVLRPQSSQKPKMKPRTLAAPRLSLR